MSHPTSFGSVQSELLTPPSALEKEFPATIAHQQFVEQTRETIVRILNGKDGRMLLIMGPCSIHDLQSAEQYAKNLSTFFTKISDTFFPVMRVYFEKPRTLHGWKGIMHDPKLDGSYDINEGLRLTRKLLLRLAEIGVPAAAEILDPISGLYFGDLLSWGCIGARTSSSQLHRQAASGLPMPVAFKNNTDGNIEIAIHGALTASHPSAYIGIDRNGVASVLRTKGNPNCHIVLRGGEKEPNYDSASVGRAIALLKKTSLSPHLIIDCSHDNSRRDHTLQLEVFKNVIDQVIEGNRAIKGCVLESHLFPGNQAIPADLSLLKYAVSLTDACMDWETTEKLVLSARDALLRTQQEANEASTVTGKAVFV